MINFEKYYYEIINRIDEPEIIIKKIIKTLWSQSYTIDEAIDIIEEIETLIQTKQWEK